MTTVIALIVAWVTFGSLQGRTTVIVLGLIAMTILMAAWPARSASARTPSGTTSRGRDRRAA